MCATISAGHCFLPHFVELKYEERMIPMKRYELATCEASNFTLLPVLKNTLEEGECAH